MSDAPQTQAAKPALTELIKPVITVLEKVTGKNSKPLTVDDQAAASEFLKVYTVLTTPASPTTPKA